MNLNIVIYNISSEVLPDYIWQLSNIINAMTCYDWTLCVIQMKNEFDSITSFMLNILRLHCESTLQLTFTDYLYFTDYFEFLKWNPYLAGFRQHCITFILSFYWIQISENWIFLNIIHVSLAFFVS